MSVAEGRQQAWLHERLGGTMVREFPAVRGRQRGALEPRKIDSVIFPNVPSVTLRGESRSVVPEALASSHVEELLALMRQEPVVCVQAKVFRLGPQLLGQALFSPRLLERHGVQVERSIALCADVEPDLKAVAEEVYGLAAVKAEGDAVDLGNSRWGRTEGSGLRPHLQGVEAYLRQWEGASTTYRKLNRARNPYMSLLTSSGEEVRFDALVVHGREPRPAPTHWADLAGLDVTLVASTHMGLGMWVMGVAVFTRALAQRAGARASAVIVARNDDLVLGPLLAAHPGVSLRVPERESVA